VCVCVTYLLYIHTDQILYSLFRERTSEVSRERKRNPRASFAGGRGFTSPPPSARAFPLAFRAS
jgi:hypothetical protein